MVVNFGACWAPRALLAVTISPAVASTNAVPALLRTRRQTGRYPGVEGDLPMADGIRKSTLSAAWPVGLSAMQYASFSGRIVDQAHYRRRLVVGCSWNFNFESEVRRCLKRMAGSERERGAD
jgi:hypothetical protein